MISACSGARSCSSLNVAIRVAAESTAPSGKCSVRDLAPEDAHLQHIATEDDVMSNTDSPAELLIGPSKSGKKRTIHDVEHQNKNMRVQQRLRLALEDIDMTDDM